MFRLRTGTLVHHPVNPAQVLKATLTAATLDRKLVTNGTWEKGKLVP
jgi:hypothetical protein